MPSASFLERIELAIRGTDSTPPTGNVAQGVELAIRGNQVLRLPTERETAALEHAREVGRLQIRS